MATEQTTSLLRFEDTTAPYVLDDVAGLNPLFPAYASYPSSAAALAAAVGYGTWSSGWLLDEAAGNFAPAFGGITLTSSTAPTYHVNGPIGPNDFAIAIAGAAPQLTDPSAADFDVAATDDLVVAWIGRWDSIPTAAGAMFGKVSAAFANGWAMTSQAGTGWGFFAGASGGSSSALGANYMVGKWHVGIAVVDRGAGKIRVAVTALDGSESYVGTNTTIAGSLTTATAMTIGNNPWTTATYPWRCAAFFVGKGASAALNMSTNLSAAVANLRASVVAQLPTHETGLVGNAAVFDGTRAISATDQTIGATALPRDITVQAIMRWDLAAQIAKATSGTIIARGRGDSSTEYMPFGLELAPIDATTGQVRWIWHTAAGVLKSEIGAGFIIPGSNYFLLTCTRRWVSLTSVVNRYYIGDQLLAEVASADGDIASSSSGTTSVGARASSGALTNFLCGAIDELRVLNYEMSAEEIRSIWHRMTVTQPDGLRQFKDMLPIGLPVNDDPASRVQSDFASGGAALGFVDGLIENFRSNIMPDRAYGSILRRWEGITREPAGALDSLDTRRKRVIGHIGQRSGPTVVAVETQIAPALACQPTDLVPLGFDDSYRDTFATLNDRYWFMPTPSAVDVIGNELRIQIGSGLSRMWNELSPMSNAYAALLPVNARQIFSQTRYALPAVAVALDIVSLPQNVEAGIVIASWVTGTALFFGVRNNGGTKEITYQIIKKGVVTTASQSWTGWNQTDPICLRIRPPLSSTFAVGFGETAFEMHWSNTATFPADDSGWALVAGGYVGVPADLDYMGFYSRTANGGAASAAASDVRIKNISVFRDTLSDRPFYQYMYRNPALPGTPDIAGANRIYQRMRHGYTQASVIQSMDLICDDTTGRSTIDSTPLGGI